MTAPAPLGLVTTAVESERDAVAAALGAVADVELGPYRALRCPTGWGLVDVVSLGVGPVSAAAGTATCLGVRSFDAVVCAGIAGRYEGGRPGGESPGAGGTVPSLRSSQVVVADRVALDGFGAGSGRSFRDASALGLGATAHSLEPDQVRWAARRTGGRCGTVVTVLAASGSPAQARDRAERWDGCAEAMEGAGAYAAARLGGAAFLEVRAISNQAGDRDKNHWDIEGALAHLGTALRLLFDGAWT